MQAGQGTLQKLLLSPDQYVIPVFQRFYTWDRENWAQLLSDLEELLEADGGVQSA